MRYTEADVLTREQSAQLLADLEDWCRKTGTSYTRLVTFARVPPSTRSRIRRGLCGITHDLANRMRTVMRDHPQGILKTEKPSYCIIQHKPDPTPIPDRSPCPRCGVRADIGCSHRPLMAGLSVSIR
jgi:hypothetical protein